MTAGLLVLYRWFPWTTPDEKSVISDSWIQKRRYVRIANTTARKNLFFRSSWQNVSEEHWLWLQTKPDFFTGN